MSMLLILPALAWGERMVTCELVGFYYNLALFSVTGYFGSCWAALSQSWATFGYSGALADWDQAATSDLRR